MKNQYIFLTALLFVAVVSCKSRYDTTKETISVAERDDSRERGKNLVYNICGQCHYNRETGTFIGKKLNDLPKFVGKVYSDNITDHPTEGIGDYSNAEMYYLLRTGISNHGRYIPYMVRPNLADEDINDILVYLRSGDGAVKGRDTSVGKTKLSLLGKIGTSIAGKPLPYKRNVQRPDENNVVATGRYLVDNIGCFHCHSKSITSLNYMEPEKSKGYMAGGMKWKIEGKKIYASNITPHKETGIGAYTKEDFREAVRTGRAPGNKMLRYPMPKFKHMTDKQLDAMYAYIQTLKPVDKKIKGQSK